MADLELDNAPQGSFRRPKPMEAGPEEGGEDRSSRARWKGVTSASDAEPGSPIGIGEAASTPSAAGSPDGRELGGVGLARADPAAADPACAPPSLPLHRKVLHVALDDLEQDVCSICLDEYTEDDPGVSTSCRHLFHLQCCMQWAQRSRECPLCFRALRLEDPAMNELLPFGEYAPPEATADSRAALEAFELERLLYRLAAAEERAERREARARRAAAREASAPRPIAGGGSAGPSGDAGGGAYPASWPPAGGGADAAGEVGAALRSLRSRLSSLKLRESLGKATKEVRALFAAPGASPRAPASPPPRH